MARVEDSPWAISVAQVATRAGQSKEVDGDFPAPEGIGDDIVGVKPGAPIHVSGSFDSIVDGLIFSGRISAPVSTECTRCLTPIEHDWPVDVTVFFPYASAESKHETHGGKGRKAKHEAEVDIIAGKDESEDTYPLLMDGAFADIEAMLRDSLVEALPLQPLCREDCRGLCPQCGENLNEHPDHHHDVADIRFASLAALKAQLEANAAESEQ